MNRRSKVKNRPRTWKSRARHGRKGTKSRSGTAPPCPACSSRGPFLEYCPASFLQGDGRRIEQCPGCGLSRLFPLPSPRELSDFYHSGYYNFNRHSEEGKGYYWARRLKSFQPKGRFLDIGCATGFFLNGVKKNCGWEVFGQETGKEAAAYARKTLGLDVRGVPLEKAGFPGDFFDFIHFNNVLEHVLDPDSMLNEAGRILKPGGRLFLSIPNGEVNRRIFKNYYDLLGQRGASTDGHLYFFTHRSLSLLARKAGLRIERSSGSGWKRALRVLGYWPQKKGWELEFKGRRPGEGPVAETVEEGKPRPRWYYLFKHGREDLLRFPGFPGWSYDFTLYLAKDMPLRANKTL